MIINQFSEFTYSVIENKLFKAPCYYENIISNKRDVEEKMPSEIMAYFRETEDDSFKQLNLIFITCSLVRHHEVLLF